MSLDVYTSLLQRPLLKRLYYIPEAPRMQTQGTTYINIEGYLEKLPSGRKKATFWNAWKRRYFVAKDGVLYYYQVNKDKRSAMPISLQSAVVQKSIGYRDEATNIFCYSIIIIIYNL